MKPPLTKDFRLSRVTYYHKDLFLPGLNLNLNLAELDVGGHCYEFLGMSANMLYGRLSSIDTKEERHIISHPPTLGSSGTYSSIGLTGSLVIGSFYHVTYDILINLLVGRVASE